MKVLFVACVFIIFNFTAYGDTKLIVNESFKHRIKSINGGSISINIDEKSILNKSLEIHISRFNNPESMFFKFLKSKYANVEYKFILHDDYKVITIVSEHSNLVLTAYFEFIDGICREQINELSNINTPKFKKAAELIGSEELLRILIRKINTLSKASHDIVKYEKIK